MFERRGSLSRVFEVRLVVKWCIVKLDFASFARRDTY